MDIVRHPLLIAVFTCAIALLPHPCGSRRSRARASVHCWQPMPAGDSISAMNGESGRTWPRQGPGAGRRASTSATRAGGASTSRTTGPSSSLSTPVQTARTDSKPWARDIHKAQQRRVVPAHVRVAGGRRDEAPLAGVRWRVSRQHGVRQRMVRRKTGERLRKSFRYDITDVANYGAPNVVAVRVDASRFEGWVLRGSGGIYRHVWLVKTSPLAVAPDGVFVFSRFKNKVPDGPAEVHFQARLTNAGGRPMDATGDLDGPFARRDERRDGAAIRRHHIQRLARRGAVRAGALFARSSGRPRPPSSIPCGRESPARASSWTGSIRSSAFGPWRSTPRRDFS